LSEVKINNVFVLMFKAHLFAKEYNRIRNKCSFLIVPMKIDLVSSIIGFHILEIHFLAMGELTIIVWFMKVVENDYLLRSISCYHLNKVIIVYEKV
jgi:hypothetical protein